MMMKLIVLVIALIIVFQVLIPMLFNGFNALKMVVWWMFP